MAVCERLIGTEEVAAILGLSESYVKLKARRQEIPMKKIGKLWRIRESELDEWYRSQVHSPQTSADAQEREQ